MTSWADQFRLVPVTDPRITGIPNPVQKYCKVTITTETEDGRKSTATYHRVAAPFMIDQSVKEDPDGSIRALSPFSRDVTIRSEIEVGIKFTALSDPVSGQVYTFQEDYDPQQAVQAPIPVPVPKPRPVPASKIKRKPK